VEALYFHPKFVLAFHFPNQELPEKELLQYFHLFTNETELISQFMSAIRSSPAQVKDAREFFKTKFGVVDGHEIERLSALRNWNTAPSNRPSSFLLSFFFFFLIVIFVCSFGRQAVQSTID
jgi:hypothetical protein